MDERDRVVEPASSFAIEAQYEMEAELKLGDIRFEDGREELLLGSKRTGVIRFARSSRLVVLERGLATLPGGRYSAGARQVASSEDHIVTGQVVGSISWVSRAKSTFHTFHAFDGILDLDVFGRSVAVMAARRDGPKGAYAHDGAIVSTGTLGETVEDLRPLHLSIDGPGASTFEKCSILRIGHVRYLRDGSLVVLPGSEPGLYRYNPEGMLEETWQTDKLGIDTDCLLTERQADEIGRDLDQQIGWLNQRTIVDDIVPLESGPALIVRELEDGFATWQLWILHEQDQAIRHRLPFRRPSYQRIQADVDGDRLVFLFTNERASNPIPQDVVMMSIGGSASDRRDRVPAVPE